MKLAPEQGMRFHRGHISAVAIQASQGIPIKKYPLLGQFCLLQQVPYSTLYFPPWPWVSICIHVSVDPGFKLQEKICDITADINCKLAKVIMSAITFCKHFWSIINTLKVPYNQQPQVHQNPPP